MCFALLALGAPRTPAQEAERRPDRPLSTWLEEQGLEPDSVVVQDVARAPSGVEALLLRVGAGNEPTEYRVVTRRLAEPAAVTPIGTLSGHWREVALQATLADMIVLRKVGGYGQGFLHQYLLEDGRVVEQGEYLGPRPGSMLIHGDTAFATWTLHNEGELVLALSLRDGGGTGYYFESIKEGIEEIYVRGDTVFFGTPRRKIFRRGGVWAGSERHRRSYEPPHGVELLHPRLPQFRVVPGGIEEIRLTDTLFIPLDFPDLERFRRSRPDHLVGLPAEHLSIGADIGPVTDDGSRIWFGLQFYDGEGKDGVGGLGWLDPIAREAELIYPPEMADWSVSAISVHDGSLLVGLAWFGEGAAQGCGIGRYEPSTGAFQQIEAPGLISALTVHDGVLYALSSDGLLEIRPSGGGIARWRVFPPRGLHDQPPVVADTVGG